MNNKSTPKQHSATYYQGFYLANLLLLPGFCFFYLVYCLYYSEVKPKWVKIHLIRAVQLSVAAGILLVLLPLLVLTFTSQFTTSLMVMIFYIVTLHAGFVLIGMLNISRAMAKKLPLF